MNLRRFEVFTKFRITLNWAKDIGLDLEVTNSLINELVDSKKNQIEFDLFLWDDVGGGYPSEKWFDYVEFEVRSRMKEKQRNEKINKLL